MKQLAWTCAFLLLSTVPGVADTGNDHVVGAVSAVYHEGVVSFAVEHPEAVATQVLAFDRDTDELVFDSGPRRGTRVAWPIGRDASGAWRYVVKAWSQDGELVIAQSAASRLLQEITAIPFETIPAGIALVATEAPIVLEGDVEFGPLPRFASLQEWYGLGGRFDLFDNDGNTSLYLQADGNGAGGYMALARSTSAIGIKLDGNASGTYSPSLTLSGASRSAVLDMSVSGDSSVVLPNDAVSRSEILDEPGVAGNVNTDYITLSSGADPAPLTSRTITLPTNGHVIAIATTSLSINYISYLGTAVESTIDYGLSLVSNTIPVDNGYFFKVLSHYDDGLLYYDSPTIVQLFSNLTAGNHTIYLNAAFNTVNTASASASRSRLTLLFVPTSYGSLPPSALKTAEADQRDENVYLSRGPMSAEELARERETSIAVNQARIDAELGEMRARVAELERQMKLEP